MITSEGKPAARARGQGLKHGLVPEVHAIEVADGGHAASMSRAQVVQSPDQ